MNLAPLSSLELRTPRLVLRLGTRDELAELGQLAEAGIHPPEEMPFAVPWTDAIGAPDFLEQFLGFHYGRLAALSVEEWHLNLLVCADGMLAGTQGISATRLATSRTVTTGSWLGRELQGSASPPLAECRRSNTSWRSAARSGAPRPPWRSEAWSHASPSSAPPMC